MAYNRPDDLILSHMDEYLRQFGDTAKGAHWPNEKDRITRFDVMLGVIRDPSEPQIVCDFGCGTGEMLSRIRSLGLNNIKYIGVDRSELALGYARKKFPDECFLEMDVLAHDANVEELSCDYLVSSGVFTVKWEMSNEEMWAFVSETLQRLWPVVRKGMAFNVMSKAVDWERDDLFHASMDDMARLLHKLAGRRIVFRSDYGLYEYTAYVFR
jgi:SAM-dependent methyltransferase